jgi:hypothetical protein
VAKLLTGHTMARGHSSALALGSMVREKTASITKMEKLFAVHFLFILCPPAMNWLEILGQQATAL